MNMERPTNTFCNRTHRREFIKDIGGGFAALGLTGMLAQDGFFSSKAMAKTAPQFINPLAPKNSPLPGKAKSVIFLFMYGGPSHVDTFDYKPELYPLDGKTIKVRTFGRGGKRNESRVVGPKWKFKPYGDCGKYVSDLFPHIGSCVDDIAFLHSMKAESPIHGSAMLMMNAGNLLSGHPSLGSWVNYGLGSVNENLPGYVVMLDKTGGPISGAKNWSSGYMPASFQGTVLFPRLSNFRSGKFSWYTPFPTANMLDHLRTINEGHLSERYDNTNLSARVASYELAYKDAGICTRSSGCRQRARICKESIWHGWHKYRRFRPKNAYCLPLGRAGCTIYPNLFRRSSQ